MRTSSPRPSSAISPLSRRCSRPIPVWPRRRIRRSTSSTSHPSNTRSQAVRSQRCGSSWTTSHLRGQAMRGRCAVPPHQAAWRWSSCCWHTGRTRHGSASDAGSFIPNSLRCWPAGARRSTPPARGSVPAVQETRVARTIRSMSAPCCTTVPARTTAGPATRKARPASGLSMRRRCTTPPGQGSCGPSRYSSSTEQIQTPATVTAARRLTGWSKRHRRRREPQSGT